MANTDNMISVKFGETLVRIRQGKGPGISQHLLVAPVSCALKKSLVTKGVAGSHFVALPSNKRGFCIESCKLKCVP